jgi:hypothetical protein
MAGSHFPITRPGRFAALLLTISVAPLHDGGFEIERNT